jgi:spermidine/putrescine transport system permease protein
MKRITTWWLPIIACGLYLFLYIPIGLLILFSCNDAAMPGVWGGFTTRWYAQLWEQPELWIALKNSLIVALSAALLSVTMSVAYVCWAVPARLHKLFPLFYAGIAIPEIVFAVSLLVFFSALKIPLGMVTLVVGHTLLGLGFALPLIRTHYHDIDQRLLEASYDLGASERQTFFKIVLPLLRPALIASCLLVFVLSFDDFLISFFCAGPDGQTISLYLFGLIRMGASPLINALSTIILLASSVCVLFFCSINTKDRGI